MARVEAPESPVRAIVLDPLPFEIDAAEVCRRLRVPADGPRGQEVAALIESARRVGRPRAVFVQALVSRDGGQGLALDGVAIGSSILQVKLKGADCAFPFVCTAGSELAEWTAAQNDLLLQFYADAISQAVLSSALDGLQVAVRRRHDLGPLARLSPGSLPDWPLEGQRPLFRLLDDGPGRIGVTLTESLLMVPTKTVSGILFAGHEGFTSCRLCPRADCPNRRAPHDAGLMEREFGVGRGVKREA